MEVTARETAQVLGGGGARLGRRLAALALAGLLAGAGLLIQRELAAGPLICGLIAAAAICWRPLLGLYLAFGLVLLFEIGVPDPVMAPGRVLFMEPLSTFGINGVSLNALEMILLWTLVAWLAHGAAARSLAFQAGEFFWPVALFSVALLGGLIRGLVYGGNLDDALAEARGLVLLPLCYLLAANLVRGTAAVRWLNSTLLLGAGLFAIEGVYRKIFLIKTGAIRVIPDLAFDHPSVIFLASLILLPLAFFVTGAPLWQRMCSAPFALAGLFTLLASHRRAGIAALAVAFLAYGLVLLVCQRRAFWLVVVPIVAGGLIYLPLFWRQAGMLGEPARAVRSLVQPDQEDAESNEYRDEEKANIREALLANPLLGVGFGHEAPFVGPKFRLPDWPFWRYMPHHNILWIWLKTGLVGFVTFWTLMGWSLGLAANQASRVRQPDERSFALVALAGISATLVFSYVDVGLAYARVSVFLGTLIGCLAVLGQSTREED